MFLADWTDLLSIPIRYVTSEKVVVGYLLLRAYLTARGRNHSRLIQNGLMHRLEVVEEEKYLTSKGMFPLKTRKISGYCFGERAWYQVVGAGHLGVDYGGSIGDPIYCPFDATVVRIQRNAWDVGNMVVIRLKDRNLYMRLMHMSEIKCGLGEVKKGQVLGLVGNTGLSKGAHLHLDIATTLEGEFWRNIKNFQDPEKFDWSDPVLYVEGITAPPIRKAKVTSPSGVNVRRIPHLGNNITRVLKIGDEFYYDCVVKGDVVSGWETWLRLADSKDGVYEYIWEGAAKNI